MVRVEVATRELVAGGAPFGAAGPYERITGRIWFAFDPDSPHDFQMVDLALAPRNARGEVEASSEFVMLRPETLAMGAGVVLVDVVNRGNMTVGVFELGADRGAAPSDAAFYGDALLLNGGLTIVMLGWQWGILPGSNGLHFFPPIAGNPAHPITGLVRSDVTIDAPTTTISLGHRVGASQALAYPVANPDDPANVLTVRDSPLGERRVVPRTSWVFGRGEHGLVVRDPRSIYLASGFEPGKIYEAIYRAQDPVVVGTGLAAVRDVVSWLKYDPTSLAPARFGIAYGVSQTGRFLRHFLYQGFNTDEAGRRAFDGIFAHTPGAGRGSFNHRFAQPSRDAQPYNTFFYPTDVFPFTSVEETDPLTGARDGLLVHAGDTARLPKIFWVDGGYEYWGRALSLTHTSVDGARDVDFTPDERLYVLSSAQHSSPAAWPPPAGARVDGPAWRGDPMDQRLALRALLVNLVDWVRDGRAPPASIYPTLWDGLLVSAAAETFPRIPGVPVARIPYQNYRMDFGPRWSHGIIDVEPPRIGAPFAISGAAGRQHRERPRRDPERGARGATRDLLPLAAPDGHARRRRPPRELPGDLRSAAADGS